MYESIPYLDKLNLVLQGIHSEMDFSQVFEIVAVGETLEHAIIEVYKAIHSLNIAIGKHPENGDAILEFNAGMQTLATMNLPAFTAASQTC